MKLLRRQSFDYKPFDDQGPELWGAYVGNWTHYLQLSAYNSTITVTPNPGASFTFTFSGSQAFIQGCAFDGATFYGCVLKNDSLPIAYPAADYTVDGIPSVPGTPYLEPSGQIIYFVTPILAPGTHTIDVKVSAANSTNYYVLDRIEVAFENTSVASSTPSVDPGSSAHSASVSATVGGVVAGVAGVAILVIIYLFLKKRKRGGQPNFLEGYGVAGVPIGRNHATVVSPWRHQ